MGDQTTGSMKSLLVITGPPGSGKTPIVMLSQAVADFRRMSGAPGPVFFDRGIPDLIGYAELFGLDASAATTATAMHRYNDLVFVLPSWPEIYRIDSERRMTFEAAEAFGERVRRLYIENGYSVVDVPRDTVVARARFIVDTLNVMDRSVVAPAG